VDKTASSARATKLCQIVRFGITLAKLADMSRRR
jgi:hypothetical protein